MRHRPSMQLTLFCRCVMRAPDCRLVRACSLLADMLWSCTASSTDTWFAFTLYSKAHLSYRSASLKRLLHAPRKLRCFSPACQTCRQPNVHIKISHPRLIAARHQVYATNNGRFRDTKKALQTFDI